MGGRSTGPMILTKDCNDEVAQRVAHRVQGVMLAGHGPSGAQVTRSWLWSREGGAQQGEDSRKTARLPAGHS